MTSPGDSALPALVEGASAQGVVAEGRRQRRIRVPGDGPAAIGSGREWLTRPAAVEALALQDRRLPRRGRGPGRRPASMQAIVSSAASCGGAGTASHALAPARRQGPAGRHRWRQRGRPPRRDRQALDESLEPGKRVQRRVVDVCAESHRSDPLQRAASRLSRSCPGKRFLRTPAGRAGAALRRCRNSRRDPSKAVGLPPPRDRRRSRPERRLPRAPGSPAARGRHPGRSRTRLFGVANGSNRRKTPTVSESTGDARVRVVPEPVGDGEREEVIDLMDDIVTVTGEDLEDETLREPRPDVGRAEHPFAMDLPALAEGSVRQQEGFRHRDRLGEGRFCGRNEWRRRQAVRRVRPRVARRCDPRPWSARTDHGSRLTALPPS